MIQWHSLQRVPAILLQKRDFLLSQSDGEALRPFGTYHVVDPAEVEVKHVTIQKRAQR